MREEFHFPHDVRGWLDYPEGHALWGFARGKVVLEIGTYCGKSAISMAQSASEVHCVDPFADNDANSGYSEKEFLENAARYNVLDKIVVHKGLSQDVLPEMHCRFAFAFIDGDHTYEAVSRDIQLVLPLLMPGSWLAFHDYSDIWPDCKRAINDWIGDRIKMFFPNQLLVVQV